jgi:hypothetical protein
MPAWTVLRVTDVSRSPTRSHWPAPASCCPRPIAVVREDDLLD